MKNLTIKSGTITATSSTSKATSFGIWCDETITISGGEVNADATAIDTNGNAGGMIANSYTITGGKITVIGKKGLSANNNTNSINISGGEVTATGTASSGSYNAGIYGKLNFSGGTVIAKSANKALNGTLDLTSGAAIVTASTNEDGSEPVEYDAENLANYKYLKVKSAASVSEQFSLTPGGTYYFDLSGEKDNVGTINTNLPDTSLHYVPFTYAGTVNAYSLPSAMAITQEQASESKSDRSLFVGDYNVGKSVSWNALDTAGLIFGKPFDTNYKLRSLSAGSSKTGSAADGNDHVGQPNTNEWDQILNKLDSIDNATGWIKNWDPIASWGQDTHTDTDTQRAVRGYYGARYWNYNSSRGSFVLIGFRPALEVLNPATLGADGLKAVTLKLDGGKLKESTADINIICAGNSFTAPSGEGLTAPAGKMFDSWKDTRSETTYAAGATVPNTVTGLTAQWVSTHTDLRKH